MTESIYKEYENKYYNPNDNDKRPGDNDNWKSIQKGFHDIGSTQLETSEGLTLGKGTEDETSVTAAELKEIKNPTQLETSGGLTLGKGTEDEVSVTAAELGEMKSGGGTITRAYTGFIESGTFVSGWNNNILQNAATLFPPTRLNNFTPGKHYRVTGTWGASDSNNTQGAIGIIVPLDIVADSEGQIDVGTVIPYMGISTGAFSHSFTMTLIVAERG